MSNFSLTVLLLLVTAIWGWTFALVKDAVAEYGVVSFLAVRFVIGSVALAPWVVGELTRRPCSWAAGSAWYWRRRICFRPSASTTRPPTNCGLITGLFVIFALLANRVLYWRPDPPADLGGGGVSLLGLLLLTGAGPSRRRSAIC